MADNGNDDENENILGEEDAAVRRHQVLMMGVVLLGIISICLSVSMPSDLEFDNTAIPSSDDHNPITNVVNNDEQPPTLILIKNTTNFTSKGFIKGPEESVPNSILRTIAIHKTIKGLQKDQDENQNQEPQINPRSSSSSEDERVHQIVQSFINTEEFEDFIIDVEITDAIKRFRRKRRGYKKRDSSIFDDLFKQIESHFIGDNNPDEVRLIRRVGQELESRARAVISQRRRQSSRGEEVYEDELVVNEIYNDWEMVSSTSSGEEIDENGETQMLKLRL